MAIDDKPASAWDEADLQELCGEGRRETQRLEFKGELHLDTDAQKLKVERHALGMAAGGGGHIIYGIAEVDLPDGGRAAGELQPLADGSLYERLEAVLDSRGQPRLVFELHPVRANDGGLYLVLEISGRRRPHRASDGRYYGRRGTRVREMEEAEVAEAYRERFLREAGAVEHLRDVPPNGDLPPHVLDRIHRGLKPSELAMRDDPAELGPPGWLSVVVLPDPPRSLLDPVRDRDRFDSIDIPDRWDADHAPLQYFDLRPRQDGLHAQLPPSDEFPPAYLVSMYRDGVMEYGTTLEPALRHDEPEENRIIFSASHTFQAHDYLQAFAVALGTLGYDGPVAAQVSFDNTRGVTLGVSRSRDLRGLHPIEEDRVRGELWRGSREELVDAAGRITKDVMDRVFLAAGIRSGCWFIDEDGHVLER